MKKSEWKGLPDPYDKDFRYFLVLVWRHLQLPDPTTVQLDIAEYMQGGQKTVSYTHLTLPTKRIV